MFERISRDDKMLLAFATQEAGDLGHRQLGNDHLILGMLHCRLLQLLQVRL